MRALPGPGGGVIGGDPLLAQALEDGGDELLYVGLGGLGRIWPGAGAGGGHDGR